MSKYGNLLEYELAVNSCLHELQQAPITTEELRDIIAVAHGQSIRPTECVKQMLIEREWKKLYRGG